MYVFVIDEAANTVDWAVIVRVAEMFTGLCIPQPVVIILRSQHIRCVTFRNCWTCSSIDYFECNANCCKAQENQQ